MFTDMSMNTTSHHDRSLSDQSCLPTPEVPNLKRRKRNEDQWKQRIRKKRRNEGLQYTNNKGKVMPARKMGPPCTQTCRRKCNLYFSNCDREAIFASFWALGDIDRQRDFIINRVEKVAIKQQTKKKSATKSLEDQENELSEDSSISKDENQKTPIDSRRSLGLTAQKNLSSLVTIVRDRTAINT